MTLPLAPCHGVEAERDTTVPRGEPPCVFCPTCGRSYRDDDSRLLFPLYVRDCCCR